MGMMDDFFCGTVQEEPQEEGWLARMDAAPCDVHARQTTSESSEIIIHKLLFVRVVRPA